MKAHRGSRVRRRLALLAAAAIAAGFSWGCSGRTRTVDVDSKPTGALLYVDGEPKGRTRSTIRLDFPKGIGQRILIQISKAGYKPVMQYWTFDEVPENGKKVFPLEAD